MLTRSCALLLAALAFGLPDSAAAASRPFAADTAEARDAAEQTALAWAAQAGRAAGLPFGRDNVRVTNVHVRPNTQRAHVRLEQRLGGIPVYGGDAVVHIGPDGRIESVANRMLRDTRVDTKPDLDADEAVELARWEKGYPEDVVADEFVQLVIVPQGARAVLAYKVTLVLDEKRAAEIGLDPAEPILLIDAQTGDVIGESSDLHSGTVMASSTGQSLYSGNVQLVGIKATTGWLTGTHWMEDPVRKVMTMDMRGQTVDQWRFSSIDALWGDVVPERAAVDAHFGAERTHDYFLFNFGRNGIDGSGGPGTVGSVGGWSGIAVRVHYGSSWNNAQWSNGAQEMRFGDGNGIRYSPLVSVDVVAHEWTHGVTAHTAGLIYANESGAINEAVSDIFGAMVEFHTLGAAGDWLIGEDCFTPGMAGDSLRSMSNPRDAANNGFTVNDDPDHYSDRYTGSDDNGGVHINSGIMNHMFFLLAVGGTHRLGGTVTGIGRARAAAIVYESLIGYFSSSETFDQARDDMIAAAKALYGVNSVEATAVAQAWSAVGVV